MNLMPGVSRGYPRAIPVIRGHPRTIAAFAVALLAWLALPRQWSDATRMIAAWDVGALVLLASVALMFIRAAPIDMPRKAEAQSEGEWTVFWVTLAGVLFSFFAVSGALHNASHLAPGAARFRLSLVAATVVLSWLVTQTVFAMRYAHDFYRSDGAGALARGLQFPDEDAPDYWDFLYFAVVLGMTFQVSDVAITARRLRRLATVHGVLGFVFNAVIIALTVNLAAALV